MATFELLSVQVLYTLTDAKNEMSEMRGAVVDTAMGTEAKRVYTVV